MRIGTLTIFNNATNQLIKHQADIARTQEQISTGKRILRPSDDPAGAARALDISQVLNRLDQFEKNIIFAEQRLALEDSSLDSATQLIHRVKEIAIAANSGISSKESKYAYRSEIQERLRELVDIANTKDANSDYLYAGYKGSTKPFTQAATSVSYQGDQGRQYLQVSESRQIAAGDSGTAVFQSIRNGNGTFSANSNPANTGNGVIGVGSVINPVLFQPHNFTIQFTSATTYDVVNNTTATTILSGQTYTPGAAINFNGIETTISGAPQTGDTFTVVPSQNQDVFATLQKLIDVLSLDTNTASQKAQFTQGINGVIGDLDQSLNHILNIRASVGARLNAIESTKTENESVTVALESSLSDIQDIDYVEAISRMEFQLFTLKAAQQSFANIQGLSLFNYIR